MAIFNLQRAMDIPVQKMQMPWLYIQPYFRASSGLYPSAYVHDDDGGGDDDDDVLAVHVWATSPPFSNSPLSARLLLSQFLLCSAKSFSRAD